MLVGAGARISAGAIDVLGGRAVGGHRQEGDDRIADRDVLDAVAEGVDGAGDVDAGRVRQRHREWALQVAAADAAVHGVERRRGDAEADLAGAGDGLLDILVAEDARSRRTRGNALPSLGPRFVWIERCFEFEASARHGSTASNSKQVGLRTCPIHRGLWTPSSSAPTSP